MCLRTEYRQHRQAARFTGEPIRVQVGPRDLVVARSGGGCTTADGLHNWPRQSVAWWLQMVAVDRGAIVRELANAEEWFTMAIECESRDGRASRIARARKALKAAAEAKATLRDTLGKLALTRWETTPHRIALP